MKQQLSLLPFSLLLILLINCSAITGEEIARLPINAVSTSEDNITIKEVSLDLKKGEEIIFWSEMDMEYQGDVSLIFKVEILKDDKSYGGVEIDPTDKNLTIGEVRSTFNNKTSWSFSGKNTKIKIKEDGNYTFKAILIATENPTLKIEKAELVLKI